MNNITTKKCSICKRNRFVSNFNKCSHHKDGLDTRCKECKAKQAQKRYWINIEQSRKKGVKHQRRFRKNNPDSAKRTRLKSKYGLTLEQHKQTYIDQNGCCPICKTPVPYDNIKTDHNHSTEQVRDLLCNRCNLWVGMVESTPDLINSVYEYLEKHNE